MSKLSNLIEVTQTGRVKLHPFNPVVAVHEDSTHVVTALMNSKIEYRLGVTLNVKGYADPGNSIEIQHLKDMCKRQLLEEVFGEFRPMIRKLERAIYKMDYDEARTALQELECEMRY